MSDLLRRLYHHLPAPARSAAATLRGLYLRSWRYGAETERLVEQALEREHWSAAQWHGWQQERLAQVLHRAATQVPYYRALWSARRRRGDRRSWDVLEHWPILEKEPLRRDPRAFVAQDCDVRQMWHANTSGTTGTPLHVWRSRSAMRALFALALLRSRHWHGVSRRDRWAMLGGQLVTPVRSRRPPFWVWNAALRQLYMSSYHLAPDLIPHYLDALAQYRIVYLFGYPSSIYELAREVLRSGRKDLEMAVVLTSGEPLRDQRAVIAAAFHCPVRETYGATEGVVAASECEAGGLHLWPEVGMVEFMEDAELVCTGLLNPDSPLIRYRIGDRAQLPTNGASCSCGRTLPWLPGIDGRSSDSLVTHDGRRVVWLNPVFYGLPIRLAQIIQETADRLRVRYVPADDFTTDTPQQLVERLRSRMGPVEVVLEGVADLPRGAGGKLRPVVSLLATAPSNGGAASHAV
ncbi:MAG TPA: AMP-binding protein [Gemmatimonadales bacterium]|nr:AMP-binding protein [Gemmatimonadales bacterium]